MYYSAFRKVHYNRKTTFPAKRNTSQHQNSLNKFCLVSRAKSVLLYSLFCTSFSMPTISCMDCSVWRRNNEHKSEICLENCAQNCLDFRAKSIQLYGSVQYGLPQQKNNSAKNSPNFFLGIRALLPWKTCSLCCSLSSLEHTRKISLNLLPMSSQHVLHTTQYIHL
jgi:hypothetical protein